MSHPAPKNQIIKEIEQALHAGTSEKRVETLMRVTDLFINSAPKFGTNETQLFDDVMGHLINHVESRALVELSRRLAPVANAPVGTILRLARDDAIEVSGPILISSTRLSDGDLIEIASTKSQAHLAKIAVRPQINEQVTEILVERGDAHVANEVASNAGARFSTTGMAKLVMRADGDDRLTESISLRTDISPKQFRPLMIQATEAVRQKLLASAPPHQKQMIQQVLDRISAQVGKNPAKPQNYAEAQRLVADISQDTELAKSKVLEFADAHRVAELVAALSVLSGIPVDQIDRLLRTSNEFGMMVICKASVLELDTAYAVAVACNGQPVTADAQAFEDFHAQYEGLSVSSAQRVIRFWQGRQKIMRHFKSNEA
ncbi:MAG TPA: DUF2336 domain-containing protein [Pseudolabrys sp.]|nr:DUF2336 domain-containing protein [Pseudolabrys sp.]